MTLMRIYRKSNCPICLRYDAKAPARSTVWKRLARSGDKKTPRLFVKKNMPFRPVFC